MAIVMLLAHSTTRWKSVVVTALGGNLPFLIKRRRATQTRRSLRAGGQRELSGDSSAPGPGRLRCRELARLSWGSPAGPRVSGPSRKPVRPLDFARDAFKSPPSAQVEALGSRAGGRRQTDCFEPHVEQPTLDESHERASNASALGLRPYEKRPDVLCGWSPAHETHNALIVFADPGPTLDGESAHVIGADEAQVDEAVFVNGLANFHECGNVVECGGSELKHCSLSMRSTFAVDLDRLSRGPLDALDATGTAGQASAANSRVLSCGVLVTRRLESLT